MTGWVAGMTSGHAVGIKRAAQLRTCPRCDAYILRGLDHDTMALEVTVDTAPLTTQSELATILAGHATYDATVTAGTTILLEHRHQWRIRAPHRHTVLAAHACPGTPLDLSWLPTPASGRTPDRPPF